MKRFGVLVLMLVAALMLGGCPDEKKPDPKPVDTGPTMTDAEALIGTYSKGQHKLTFTDSNTFDWQMPRPCAAPPCPIKPVAGTYSLRHGKIYLDPKEGNDVVLDYKVNLNPRTLWVKNQQLGVDVTLGFGG